MKVKSTLLYGASGSFEEVTIKKWKKLRVLSHKASGNFSNISQRFKDQQAAVRLVIPIWKQFAAAIYAGWVESKSFPGEYADWIGYTLRNAVDFSTPGSPSVTYADIIVAKGSMPTTVTAVPTADVSDNKITVTYPSTAGYKQATTDYLGLVVRNNTQNKWIYSLGAATRADGTVDINPPAGFLVASDVLAVHTFFYGAPSTDTANTASDDVVVAKTVTA